MKTLILMRHAKSSWADSGIPDHDRPLNKRGKHDAPRMGELLLSEDLAPDWIVSSTAKRARGTARRVAESCGYAAEISLSATLYGADVGDFVEAISNAPADAERILVVSHNPGTEYFIDGLTGQDVEMPTAAIAHIRLDCAVWGEVVPGVPATLVRIWRPKEIGEGVAAEE